MVNTLLERLRLRLRELGRPLREGPSSDGGRHSSRADAGDAPQRRTEIEPTSRRQASDRTGAGEEARLPAQQPPPPKSTRLKAAVFSKKRQSGPQRQAGTIWGPTSFLDIGNAAIGDAQPERPRLMLLEVSPTTTGIGSVSNIQSWPTQPEPATASAHPFALSTDCDQHPWWIPEQADDSTGSDADALMSSPSAEASFVDAPALSLNPEAYRHPSHTLLFAVDVDLSSSGFRPTQGCITSMHLSAVQLVGN